MHHQSPSRTGDTGDIWMTREQIGMALEYANPGVAIGNIHTRHPERLDQYAIRIPRDEWLLLSLSNETYDVPIEKGVEFNLNATLSNTGGEKETYLYSNKGIMEICRWSKQPKADQFIDNNCVFFSFSTGLQMGRSVTLVWVLCGPYMPVDKSYLPNW